MRAVLHGRGEPLMCRLAIGRVMPHSNKRANLVYYAALFALATFCRCADRVIREWPGSLLFIILT